MKHFSRQIPESEKSVRKHESRGINSASVELCETELCFLQIQLIGLQNQSLETIQVCCIVVLCVSHLTILLIFTWTMNVRDQTRPTLLNRLSIVWKHTQPYLLTDDKISNLSMKPDADISEHSFKQTVDNSPTDSFSSSLHWWSSMLGVATSDTCWVVLFTNSQSSRISLHAWPSMPWVHEEKVSASSFHESLVGGFSLGPAEILDWNISLKFASPH